MTNRGSSLVLALWGKGGAGKSCTAIALASLAAAEGRRAIVLDADPQRSTSEWHGAAKHPPFAVHSTDVGAVARQVEKAKQHYSVVIIDNPPARYNGSRAVADTATHSLVCARPFRFDLTVAMDWIHFLKDAQAEPLLALTAAPPLRLEVAPPAVRLARQRLKSAGAILWRHQITHRLIHADLIQRGMTVADLAPNVPARLDYARLWFAICERTP